MLYYANIDDESCIVTRYVVNKEKPNIKIPEKNSDGLKVKYIGIGSFNNNQNTAYVVLGKNVEEIGRYAFYKNMKLIAFECSNKTKEIRSNCFSDCYKLKFFYGPRLKSIGEKVFNSCISLEAFICPKSLTELGDYAFCDCERLKEFKFSPELKVIPKGLLKKCVALTKIFITDKVENVGDYAFAENESLSRIRIGKSVRQLGDYSLSQTALKSVKFENKVEIIGNYILKGCLLLNQVLIGNRVINIGNGFVDNCPNLKAINVSPLNNKYAGVGGVLYNKKQSVLLRYPEGKMGARFSVPNNVVVVGKKSFFNNQLIKKIVFSENNKVIGKGCCSYCNSLSEVVFHEGIEIIDEQAFKRSGLKGKIFLPNSVIEIRDNAFEGCKGITEIVISYFCKKIGKDVFKGCPNLVIRANKSSYAYQYAKENNIQFEEI